MPCQDYKIAQIAWCWRKDAGVPGRNAVVQTPARILSNLHSQIQIWAVEPETRLLPKGIYFLGFVLIENIV